MRRRLIQTLNQRGFAVGDLSRLLVDDVVKDGTSTDYLEAAERLIRTPCGEAPGGGAPIALEVDDELRQCLEDYLNAPHQGRPFVDYRPDIGQHLLPSPITGNGLGTRTLRNILGRAEKTVAPPPAAGGVSPPRASSVASASHSSVSVSSSSCGGASPRA